MKDLRQYGGWALVTGASSGLGREFARLIAARGVDCVLVGLEADRLDELAEELTKAHSVKCRTLELDLTTHGFLANLESVTADIHIGMLVNNAGIGCGGAFATRDRDRLEQVVRLNCLAPVILTRALLPAMIEKGAGAVVIVSSLQGFISCPFEAAYAASKAFGLHFGEALWGEMRGTPIDVITVCPGGMKTDFFSADGLSEEDCKRMWKVSTQPSTVARLALKHLGKKPVVSPPFAWLAGFLVRFLPRRWAIFVVDFATRRLVHHEHG